MSKTYTPRPEADVLPEQRYLTERMAQIEKGMGKVAARLGTPTPIEQSLDALDRARELVADMLKQIRLRPIEEAVRAQLDWLDRAEARLGVADGEPKIGHNRIALDRRLLTDVLEGWRARRN